MAETKNIKLEKTVVITGKIKVITGLFIGADNKISEIGGVDNLIIRNPINGEPYIPGSSIKGKMRALYELKTGHYQGSGACLNCDKEDCEVCTVFGSSNTNNGSKRGPTRLIVRDAFLSDESRRQYYDGEHIVEEKNENTINRITSKAEHPRTLERIVPGVTFKFEFIYRVFDKERDEQLLEKVVYESMKLLMNDYLGGGGSRGNGKIEFVEMKIDGVETEVFKKGEE